MPFITKKDRVIPIGTQSFHIAANKNYQYLFFQIIYFSAAIISKIAVLG